MDNEEHIPPEIDKVVLGLVSELNHLHATWVVFQQLFGKSEERVAFLNEMAPSFFRLLQEALQDRLLLILARVTDPPQTGRRDNLSVQRLLALVETHAPDLRSGLSTLETVLNESATTVRAWRNRVMAHKDLATFIGDDVIAPVEKEAVQQCITTTASLINGTRAHYFGLSWVALRSSHSRWKWGTDHSLTPERSVLLVFSSVPKPVRVWTTGCLTRACSRRGRFCHPHCRQQSGRQKRPDG